MMHRDLKPENVLRDPMGRHYITDMGFTRFTRDGPPYEDVGCSYGSNQRATASYSAPEMLRHGTPHGPPVDIWALGVIAVELLQNRRLTAMTDRTARKQCRKVCEKSTDSPARDLVRSFLEEDPVRRITASAARAHPALASPLASASASCAAVDLVRPPTAIEHSLSQAVLALMDVLQFSSPQTYHAACAFSGDARSLRCPALSAATDAELNTYAVLMAGKLYEHEYWALSDLPKLLPDPFDKSAFVTFQKAMVSRRQGRLLAPFATRAPQLPSRLRRRRRKGNTPARPEISAAETAAAENAEDCATAVRCGIASGGISIDV